MIKSIKIKKIVYLILLMFFCSKSIYIKAAEDSFKCVNSNSKTVYMLNEPTHVLDVSIEKIKYYEYVDINFSDCNGYCFPISTVINNKSNDFIGVKALQGLLNHYKYNLNINGIINKDTINSLIDYQKKHIECNRCDGVCDEKTWRSLVNNFR